MSDPAHSEKFLRILSADDCRALGEKISCGSPEEPTFHYECPICINGQPRWYRITGQIKREDGRNTEVFGKAVDIHDSRMQIDELEKKASYDSVTEILNHASAKEQIFRRIKAAPEGKFALAIFDLDHFKSINDTYGHIFGDRVLKCVAQKARQNVRGDDVIARIGGDEFLIFMEYDEDENIEKAIIRVFNGLIGLYDDVPVSVSLGAAKTSVAGYEYGELFHAADQALYLAKRSGRARYLFYDDSMKETLGVVFPRGDNT